MLSYFQNKMHQELLLRLEIGLHFFSPI